MDETIGELFVDVYGQVAETGHHGILPNIEKLRTAVFKELAAKQSEIDALKAAAAPTTPPVTP